MEVMYLLLFLMFYNSVCCKSLLNFKLSVDVVWKLTYTRPFTLFIQTEKKSQDLKEKPAIEENAFEALERDFQEVCI